MFCKGVTMADWVEFKRMNFFTGFFTTAKDWDEGQQYHLEKRRLHNRGLHTPGIIRGEKDELAVVADGDLDVRVLPGAALDGLGNEIYLGQRRPLSIEPGDYPLPGLVYIAIEYSEKPTDYVVNVESPEYTDYTRVTETPTVKITTTVPDNRTSVELARIRLAEGVTQVTDPDDPDNPGDNQIDRRYVVWAGSAEEWLPREQQQQLVATMQQKRQDFAALASRCPVPSVSHVCHAAVTVEILGCIGRLRPEQLPDVLRSIAAMEQDVGEEIGLKYPDLAALAQYEAYRSAVNALQAALENEGEFETLLARQSQVATAARALSEVVLQPPTARIADKGDLSQVEASDDEATVALDASNSTADGGLQIVFYRWTKKE